MRKSRNKLGRLLRNYREVLSQKELSTEKIKEIRGSKRQKKRLKNKKKKVRKYKLQSLSLLERLHL